jgi:hypothetical protein
LEAIKLATADIVSEHYVVFSVCGYDGEDKTDF